MKYKLIGILLCFCLFLNGCSLATIFDRESTESESTKRKTQKTRTSTSESEQEQDETSKQETKEQAPDKLVIDKILANAAEDDLFAIVIDAETKYYQELVKQDSLRADLTEFLPGTGSSSIFLVGLADEVEIKIENISYQMRYSYFEPTQLLFTKTISQGEILEIDLYITENMPTISITGISPWQSNPALWHNVISGFGVSSVYYVAAQNQIPPVDYHSNIVDLAIATAVSTAIEGSFKLEVGESISPAELLETPMIYWYTVAHALTRLESLEQGQYSWLQAEIPCHIVHACGNAIFPDTAPPELDTTFFTWPDSEDLSAGVNYGSANCYMQPFEYGDLLWFHVEELDNYEDGGAYIDVYIDNDEAAIYSEVYRVIWEPLLYPDPSSPFDFQILSILRLA